MAKEKKKGGLREYFKGVRTEMKKVVWPTRSELTSYAVMVIVACVVFAVGFWILDSIFAAGLSALISI